jgi:hypothetical protein
MLAKKIVQDWRAAQRFHGDGAAAADRHGSQNSLGCRGFEVARNGWRLLPILKIEPADAEAEGAGGFDQRGEAVGAFFHSQEMRTFHAGSSG